MKKLVIYAVLTIMMVGCKTIEYVPVTVVEHKTDSVYFTKVQRDSIWLHDSIQVTEKDDTVKIEKWHTKFVEKQVHDTLYVTKHDSIAVPYPVIKEVEKPLTKTQKGLIWFGLLSFMGGVVWIAFKIKKFLP